MKFEELPIPDLIVIKPDIFGDERGFFFESYHQEKFMEVGININIAEQNHSGSKKNILRGLHYQIKNSQSKLVRVLKGRVYDVAVDIRKSSPTFGKWEGIILSEENKFLLWVPAGFAHGFYVLSDWAEVEYSTSDFYAPEHERSILWNDPDLDIKWPIEEGEYPILSSKDSDGKLFKDAEFYE